MQFARIQTRTGSTEVALLSDGRLAGRLNRFDSLAQLLRLSLQDLRAAVEAAPSASEDVARVLAPIDGETEVWAAGVTYKRSEEARVEESATPDIYTRVYRAERPELFFKATARRVAGPDAPVVVRADSTWDVPEPELAIVINAEAEIVGYTIGNDVSSRSIEGENPLYLPQAKVYSAHSRLAPALRQPGRFPIPTRWGFACASSARTRSTGRVKPACATLRGASRTWSVISSARTPSPTA